MKAESKNKTDRPKMSGEKLAAYLGNLIPLRSVQSICSQAGEESTGGGYDLQRAMTAIVAHLKKAAEKISTEREVALGRSATANAIKDEIEAAKAAGEVILASDAESMWTDRATRVRAAVQSASYISVESRARLLAELKAIKNEETP